MKKAPLGAELVIPLLALGFAVYFFVSIHDMVWIAKANGLLIGAMLVALVGIQLARVGVRLARGEGDLRFDPLLGTRQTLGKRVAIVFIAAAFIVSMHWLGLTLAMFLAMAAALYAMGAERRALLLWIPLGAAAIAYIAFIAILDAAFPHGLIERLLAALF